MLSLFFNRRISSFLALSIIAGLAFILGAIIINQSGKFKALQAEMPPWYDQTFASSTAATTNY